MPITIDDFEDGDIAEYTKVSGAGSDTGSITTSPVYEGTYAFEIHNGGSSGSTPQFRSTSGLPKYPRPDDAEYYCYFQRGNNDAVSGWSFADDGTDSIEVSLNGPNSEFSLSSTLFSTQTASYSPSTGVWYRFYLDWTPDGSITVELQDASGTTLAGPLTASSTFDPEAMSLRAQGFADQASSTYFDNIYADPRYPDGTAENVTIAEMSSQTAGTVSWTDGATNEDGYEVEKSEDGGAWTAVTTTGANETSAGFTLDAATTSFEIRVRSTNSYGTGDWASSGVFDTTVSSLSVTGERDAELDLSWDAVDDPDAYHVYQAEATGTTVSDYTEVQEVTSGSTTTITGLENGERYYYRVASDYGGDVGALSPEADGTTTVPPPSIDSLDAVTEGEIVVSYSLPDNSPDGDVVVERSRDAGGSWTSVETRGPGDPESYTDTGLLDGEEYTYRVVRSTDHASAQSPSAAAVSVLPAPSGLQATDIRETAVDIEWTPQHDYGSQTVEYRPSSSGVWQEHATGLDRTASSSTLSGLLHGEAYEIRVLAVTEHTETEDQ